MFRDPYTWEKKIRRKEVQKVVYRVDKNTAFDEILNKHKIKFANNNLKKLFDRNEYSNEHYAWKDFYNATLAVPIRYKPDLTEQENNNVIPYGVLCIDSLNPNDVNLFEDEVAYTILAHAADMLAIMLGHMDIFPLFAKLEKDIQSQENTNERS